MDVQELEKYYDLDNIPDISKRFELRAIIDTYPYFQAGIFLYLKCLFEGDDKTFNSELQRLSPFINDRKALFYYILNNEYGKFFFRKRQEKEINKNRTDILLNAFFNTLEDSAIDRQIEQTLIAPSIASTDYFTYVELEEKDPSILPVIENKPAKEEVKEENEKKKEPIQFKHQDIIDDFINNARENIKFIPEKNEGIQNQLTEKSEKDVAEELQDDIFFTETLAKIYIKQQKYERAYEIIKRLNLNYPEKNIYFANQLSFLEKLIINKKHKNKK